ncbi:hypothetical protein HK096_009749, partial [Nowakowskiella sp. JEL0078]
MEETIEEWEAWDDDEPISTISVAKVSPHPKKVPISTTPNSEFTVLRSTGENIIMPKMIIMKRIDSEEQKINTQPIEKDSVKTLIEREAEYKAVREQIFGESKVETKGKKVFMDLSKKKVNIP